MLTVGLIFLLLLLFIFLGFPIFMAAIITAIICVVAMDIPSSLVIIKMFGSINSFALMAIPFFIIAGNIMTESKITDKLVDFSNAIVGRFKGGLGHANILASMFFGGIQGSGAADASAIGGMLIPAMKKQGYEVQYAVAVTAGSSMLSPIIPPSIAMILYSYYTEVPVGKLFMSGILPGVVIGVLMMVVNSIYYRVRKYNIPVVKFSLKNLGKQFIKSIGALITPMIILCGIVFGFVTPTESGVLAILYGLFYGFFISRELKISAIPRILLNSAVTTAVVMVTIAATGVLGNVLVRLHFQAEIVNFAINVIQNPYLASFFIMAVMLVLGCFLDPTVLIAMFAVSILNIGNAFGFDPIHYGLIMIIVMQIGAITPPVGTFLYISCGIGGITLEQSVKPLLPFILVIMVVVIAMLFIPGIATWVPSLLGKL